MISESASRTGTAQIIDLWRGTVLAVRSCLKRMPCFVAELMAAGGAASAEAGHSSTGLSRWGMGP